MSGILKPFPHCIEIIINQVMCFIKNSCLGSRSLYDSDSNLNNGLTKSPQAKCFFNSQSELSTISNSESFSSFFVPDYSILSQMFGSLVSNSELLSKLQKDIEDSEKLLDQALQLASDKQEEIEHKAETGMTGEIWNSSDKTLKQLFGDRQYRYRLKLKGKFPLVIYKERNITLSMELVDNEGKLVLNSNLINLCMAASEINGQWIPQNEEGDYFIKGKTEVELYHGEANFQKVYPRDVSRQFQDGKLNIIIYPKPSLIQFSTYSSSVQERVRAEEIQPMLISDVTIRAKKKSPH